MACPLFRRDELDAFMRVYGPDRVCYGTDWRVHREFPAWAYLDAKGLARHLGLRALS